ncbi:MAG: baseplate J/gp47 family protein [Bacteroidota bacterium]|nr:baseplate J/gp47 family protein [Bacteroidota bacterium]
MSDCSKKRTPLTRSGTSQDGRSIDALRPSSVEVVDRTPEDWMVWAGRLAEHLRFYDTANQASGSLAPLFTRDLVARLAAVSTHAVDSLPTFFRERLNVLMESSTPDADLQSTFTELFDVMVSYLATVDRHYVLAVRVREALLRSRDADEDDAVIAPVKEYVLQLENHIQRRLFELQRSTVAYYKSAGDNGLLGAAAVALPDIFHAPAQPAALQLQSGFSALWWRGEASYAAWDATVAADDTVLGMTPAAVGDAIPYAARHHFFTGLLDDITASSGFLVALAQRTIEKLLSNWPHHPPQYALYLAWLRLMEHAREEMNLLPARHLDFYYRRVLRLTPAPAEADAAYLAIELSRAAATHAIAAGTRFSAGKDSEGRVITYASVKDVVINRATIAALKSLYIEGSGGEAGLYAADVVNSADGEGAELTGEPAAWHPFRVTAENESGEEAITMPRAEIGFAIASRFLFLQEGDRSIELYLHVDDVTGLPPVLNFDGWITTEKEWKSCAVSAAIVTGTPSSASKETLRLTVTLGGGDEAVTGYAQDVHGHRFATGDPVLKVLLRRDSSAVAACAKLSALTLEDIELQVGVGHNGDSFTGSGLTGLELHNDVGQLNAAKPFMPFGAEPTVGSALYIGSEELAKKSNARVQLVIRWKDLPDSPYDLDYDYSSGADYHSIPSTNNPAYGPAATLAALESGVWNSKLTDEQLVEVSGDSPRVERSFQISLAGNAPFFLPRTQRYMPYSDRTRHGFLRLRLEQDFGHRNYRHALVNYLLKKGNNPSLTTAEPAVPYQPVIESLRLRYAASCAAEFPTRAEAENAHEDVHFLHIAPFGDARPLAATSGGGVPLLAPLVVPDGATLPAQGECYLGFENLLPGASISVLIQLMEGSEDPRIDKPDAHVSWWYLAENEWKPFDDDLQDGTQQLLRSGLVECAIPRDATTDNTLLPPGYIWLKAKAEVYPDAVCRIIGVHGNAIEVRRSLTGSIASTGAVMPQGSIAKLITPDAAVKKVLQPYASVNGRGEEEPEAFRQRVSERLRHKDRAITIWDYERLVLQHFPEIYKVKCLNHTKITGSAGDGSLQYNEVAPGWVTIITVPDLLQRNDGDVLRPYTKLSTLERIADFLAARISCHVKLCTAQPLFEAIQIAAAVVLRPAYTDVHFYTRQLAQDVTAFLSPWAYGGAASIEFGGQVHKSVIIDFIEERPYVDYLTDVHMYHITDDAAASGVDRDVITASTARSILVSADADAHVFDLSLAHADQALHEQCDE